MSKTIDADKEKKIIEALNWNVKVLECKSCQICATHIFNLDENKEKKK